MTTWNNFNKGNIIKRTKLHNWWDKLNLLIGKFMLLWIRLRAFGAKVGVCYDIMIRFYDLALRSTWWSTFGPFCDHFWTFFWTNFNHFEPLLKFFRPFWTILKSFFTIFESFWIIFDNFWTIFEPFLNHFWIILDHFWTIFGSFLPLFFLPFLDNFWITFGSFLDRFEPFLNHF